MPHVRIVLVRPERSANIGAVARVIANTGLEGLDLVDPCDWRTVEAWRTAWRAEDILENARVLKTLPEAVGDAIYVAGLVGRKGMRVESLTPRQMSKEVGGLSPEASVRLVFGCESQGLTEEELLLCQRRVTIPSHPAQPSLNLAQAVMVTAYEVFLASNLSIENETTVLERAPVKTLERAYALLREGMLAIGFLPEENPEARFVEWRNLFGRIGLTSREVKLLLALGRRMRGVGHFAQRFKNS